MFPPLGYDMYLQLTKIWKNWPVHNLLAHPLSELIYWIVRPFSKTKAENIAGRIHDETLPGDYENGRG